MYITFELECPKYLIYYCETIEIIYKRKEIISFDFLININKNNIAIIDLGEVGKFSFELLFYNKESKFNPKCLIYKDKSYDKFESYGNKYRRRIFFGNVDPTNLEYINSGKLNEYNCTFESNNSYHSLFRIFDNNMFLLHK